MKFETITVPAREVRVGDLINWHGDDQAFFVIKEIAEEAGELVFYLDAFTDTLVRTPNEPTSIARRTDDEA